MHQAPDRPHGSLRAWLVVAMLWLVALLNYLDRLMITTMRDSLVASIPMDDKQYGSLTSWFLWVYAALSPLAGFLADRFGRSRVIIVSLLVWSLVTWLTTLAQTYTQLALARALMGVSEACYLPAAAALIADYHRGPTRSLATGIHITGLYVGSALGFVGGFLAEHYGWRSGFMLFGMVGVVYALPLALFLRDPAMPPAAAGCPSASSRSPSLSSGIQELLRSLAEGFLVLTRQNAYLILLGAFGLFSLVNWGILTWLPTYLREQFQLSQTSAGFSATVSNQMGALAGILLGGFWSDRWSRTNPRARSLVPFLGFAVAGPCIVLGASAGVLPAALLGFAVYGMGKSFGDANWMPILCQVADRRYRATGYGVMNLVACLVGGIMAYAAGALRDSHVGLPLIFQALGVLMFAAAWLFLLIRPRHELED